MPVIGEEKAKEKAAKRANALREVGPDSVVKNLSQCPKFLVSGASSELPHIPRWNGRTSNLAQFGECFAAHSVPAAEFVLG